MNINILWFIALAIVMAAAYAWGYDNGQNLAQAGQLDAERELELQKYKCDRFYEHLRWKEERKASHDLPDA